MIVLFVFIRKRIVSKNGGINIGKTKISKR